MRKIILLCGGLGTRVSDKYKKVPKCLIPINGKPFLFHQLNLLKKYDFQEIIISINHLGSQVEKYVSSIKTDLEISCIYDGKLSLGTGGAVNKIITKAGLTKSFFVMYGDSYLPFDFNPLFKFIENYNVEDLMCVYKNQLSNHSNNVIMNKKNNVLLYDKKNFTPEMQFIDYGLNLLNPKTFSNFSKRCDASFDLSDYQNFISKKGKLTGYEVGERFYEIGSHQGISELKSFLNNQRG